MALLDFHKKTNPTDPLGFEVLYVLDVLMLLSAESAKNLSDITQLQPPNENEKGIAEVFFEFINFNFLSNAH